MRTSTNGTNKIITYKYSRGKPRITSKKRIMNLLYNQKR